MFLEEEAGSEYQRNTLPPSPCKKKCDGVGEKAGANGPRYVRHAGASKRGRSTNGTEAWGTPGRNTERLRGSWWTCPVGLAIRKTHSHIKERDGGLLIGFHQESRKKGCGLRDRHPEAPLLEGHKGISPGGAGGMNEIFT